MVLKLKCTSSLYLWQIGTVEIDILQSRLYSDMVNSDNLFAVKSYFANDCMSWNTFDLDIPKI